MRSLAWAALAAALVVGLSSTASAFEATSGAVAQLPVAATGATAGASVTVPSPRSMVPALQGVALGLAVDDERALLEGAVHALRDAFRAQFHAWREGLRDNYTSERLALRAQFHAEMEGLRANWSAQREAAAGACGDATNDSRCGDAMAGINAQSRDAVQGLVERARQARDDLAERYRAEVRAHMEELLQDLQDAIQEKLLDLQEQRAFGEQGEGRPGNASAPPPCASDAADNAACPRDGPEARCDATGHCWPPLACMDRMGTPGCVPPSFCTPLGDGSFQCSTRASLGAGVMPSTTPQPIPPPPEPEPAEGNAPEGSSADANMEGSP